MDDFEIGTISKNLNNGGTLDIYIDVVMKEEQLINVETT